MTTGARCSACGADPTLDRRVGTAYVYRCRSCGRLWTEFHRKRPHHGTTAMRRKHPNNHKA